MEKVEKGLPNLMVTSNDRAGKLRACWTSKAIFREQPRIKKPNRVDFIVELSFPANKCTAFPLKHRRSTSVAMYHGIEGATWQSLRLCAAFEVHDVSRSAFPGSASWSSCKGLGWRMSPSSYTAICIWVFTGVFHSHPQYKLHNLTPNQRERRFNFFHADIRCWVFNLQLFYTGSSTILPFSGRRICGVSGA